MNIKTGLSILNKAWLIHPEMGSQMFAQWQSLWGTDAKFEYKSEGVPKFFAGKDVVIAPDNDYSLKNFAGFDGAKIAVIPVTGPLMKDDYCGAFGTASLANMINTAANTPSIECIISIIDSPGGTVDGTESFKSAIVNAKEVYGKKTIALCNGTMCSAAYWYGSAHDEVYAMSATDCIGSIGTMCSIVDSSKALEARGVTIHEYYADASKDKNRAYREAKAGDGEMLIKEDLNPINDIFISSVKNSRPNVNSEALTGKTFISEQAIKMGLIDGIKSFGEVISQSKKSNSISNNKFMTLEQLKAEHPEVYKAAQKKGAEKEFDRVGSWLAFAEVDLKAVKEGIASGGNVSETQRSEFAIKLHSKKALGALETETSIQPLTQEFKPTTKAEEEAAEQKKLEAKIREELNWGK